MAGLFIVIEGADGSGKSTQCRLLADWMYKRGRTVYRAHDPGTTALGSRLRTLLLDKDLEMTAKQQLLLFTAARAALATVIHERLGNNEDVICDRWVLSTYIYQGVMGRAPGQLIFDLHENFVGLNPHSYIVLDVPTDVAIARKKAADDRFESQDYLWRDALRNGYKQGIGTAKTVIVDGNQDQELVHAQVLEVIATQNLNFRELFLAALGE